jgi:hypothetical protein
LGEYIGKKPIGHSAQGWPVWQYRDDSGVVRHVVVPPDGSGAPFYSTAKGESIAAAVAKGAEPQVANFVGAAVGGVLGAFFGPIGAAIGAGLGAWIAGEVAKSEKGAAK